MTSYDIARRNSSRAAAPSTFASETREAFARAAVFAEFGYRHGKAIDCADFLDRRPDQAPMPAPGARLK